jgi:Arc/MetJ family transcription regulator
MKITLNLDESLLDEALQLTKLSTQEELVSLALKEPVHCGARRYTATQREAYPLQKDGDYRSEFKDR